MAAWDGVVENAELISVNPLRIMFSCEEATSRDVGDNKPMLL